MRCVPTSFTGQIARGRCGFCAASSSCWPWWKTAGRNEEALKLARNLLAGGADDPQVQYACYITLRRLGSDESELAQCRDRLLQYGDAQNCAALWRARILRDEGQFELAVAEMEAALAAAPDNPAVIK